MSNLTLRLTTGVVAAIVLACVWLGWFVMTQPLPNDRIVEKLLPGMAMVFMLAAPLFVATGTVLTTVVDAIADRVIDELDVKWGLAYAVKFGCYVVTGYFLASAYLMMTTEHGITAWLPGAHTGLGVAMAVGYFHLGLGVSRAMLHSYLKRQGQPIETQRLILYPCTRARFFMAIEQGYPIGSHLSAYIDALRRQPKLLGWGVWLVHRKDTGAIIGDAGFKGNPDDGRTVDIGYGFLPHQWGRGYATEAVQALIAWASAHGAARITAQTLPDNAASIRVLHKNGFQKYAEAAHVYWQLQVTRDGNFVDKRSG